MDSGPTTHINTAFGRTELLIGMIANRIRILIRIAVLGSIVVVILTGIVAAGDGARSCVFISSVGRRVITFRYVIAIGLRTVRCVVV